jgi:hypothetical protein
VVGIASAYSPERINSYRFMKGNVCASRAIHTADEMEALVSHYVGIHAARAGKPFLSLLSKGADLSLTTLRDWINFDSRYFLLRCMRRTLHYCPVRHVKAVHFATRSRRLPRVSQNRGALVKESRLLLEDSLAAADDMTAGDIRSVLQKALSLGPEESETLFRYHWENGVLCLRNRSEDPLGCKRVFSLTAKVYGFRLDGDIECEKPYVDELVRRYIKAFGPVSFSDICWWTGVGRIKTRSALASLAGDVTRINIEGFKPELFLYADELDDLNHWSGYSESWCKFLSFEDSFLKAYFETRWLYCGNVARYFNLIGEVYATVVINGRCVGLWNLDKARRRVVCEFGGLGEAWDRVLVERERRRMEELIFS